MNNYDYYIAVDENGTPYIAHADGFFSNIRRKGAQYFQKIKTKYGTRYFYDPEEWKAYVEGRGEKPKTLVGKAKDKLGFDEKERRNSAADKAANSNIFNRNKREKQLTSAQEEYDKTALGKIENAGNKVKDYTGKTLGEIRDSEAIKKVQNILNSTSDTIKKSSGQIKQGVDNLLKNAQTVANKIGAPVKDVAECAKAIRDLNDAHDEYTKHHDVIRRILDAALVERIKLTNSKEYDDAVDGQHNAITKMADADKRVKATKTGRALSTINSTLSNAINSVDAAIKTANKAITEFNPTEAFKNVANRMDSRDEKAALDAAQKAYDRAKGTDDELGAYYDLQNAQAAYNRTYGAQVNNATSNVANRVNSAATSVRDTVNNLADRARGAASGAVETAQNAAANVASRAGELAGQARDAVGNAASNVRDTVTGTASNALTKAREKAAEVADRTYAREAKSNYDQAVREYEKVKNTGGEEEVAAYWAMMDAQRNLDKARGLLG